MDIIKPVEMRSESAVDAVKSNPLRYLTAVIASYNIWSITIESYSADYLRQRYLR